jgi:septal ring factor EnvC (AmiA/AmiB activator)
MSRKYKTTGCAKFFFVLIILMPLAYLGASYYNGQDGWGNLKRLVGFERSVERSESQSSNTAKEIDQLTNKLNASEKERLRLERELKACQEATPKE